MFSLGFSELFIIAVVAILVIGPKELPVVMAHVGRFVKRLSYFRFTAEQHMNSFLEASGLSDLKDQVNFEADHTIALPDESLSPAEQHKKAAENARKETEKTTKKSAKKTVAKKTKAKAKATSTTKKTAAKKTTTKKPDPAQKKNASKTKTAKKAKSTS